MRKDIITPAEADVFLAAYADWLALTPDSVKEAHIAKASVYVQTSWTCVDIDWSDDLTIPEDVKEAVAYYAYADMHSVLYGDVTTSRDVGDLQMKSVRAGDVTVAKAYFKGIGSVSKMGTNSPLGYPNSLMGTYCTANCASASALTRV